MFGAVAVALRQSAVCIFSHIAQGHAAFVHLRLLIHHLENALGAGESRQQEVDLLGELVHGHRALAHVHQVGSHGSQVRQPGHGEEAAHAGGDRVVYIGEGHDGGNGHAGVGQGLGGSLAVRLVAAAEFLEVLGLVVEYLLHLLTGHHLLHKAVDTAQVFLLPGEIFPAAPPVKADKGHHKAQKDENDHGQPPV